MNCRPHSVLFELLDLTSTQPVCSISVSSKLELNFKNYLITNRQTNYLLRAHYILSVIIFTYFLSLLLLIEGEDLWELLASTLSSFPSLIKVSSHFNKSLLYFSNFFLYRRTYFSFSLSPRSAQSLENVGISCCREEKTN